MNNLHIFPYSDPIIHVLGYLGNPEAARVCSRWKEKQDQADAESLRKDFPGLTEKEITEYVTTREQCLGIQVSPKASLVTRVRMLPSHLATAWKVLEAIDAQYSLFYSLLSYSDPQGVMDLYRVVEEARSLIQSHTFPALTHFDLSNLHLRYIPQSLLPNLHLGKVDLSHNLITQVPLKILADEKINLDGNPLDKARILTRFEKERKWEMIGCALLAGTAAILCIYFSLPWFAILLVGVVPLLCQAILCFRDHTLLQDKLKHIPKEAS